MPRFTKVVPGLFSNECGAKPRIFLNQIDEITFVSFSNQTRSDKAWLKKFVSFHWDKYKNEKRYIPLLDFEYLGSRVLGITGFFEQRNLFLKHGKSQFFLALRGDQVIGRCNAFVNHSHNEHWKDKVGFFGNFECINDASVSGKLLSLAEQWLLANGMDTIRGPQNFPVNEATPGFLSKGFESRPVVYYHFNPSYYSDLVRSSGYLPVMDILSWELSVQDNPVERNMGSLCEKIIQRYDVTFEEWGQRPLSERKKEMFGIYNEAWGDNFGFVPFTWEEFNKIIDDMQLVMDKRLFLFAYIKGEAAGFFGGVPNIFEVLVSKNRSSKFEFIRAIKMILLKSKIQGFRVGYLGVRKRYRNLGLDGVMLWKQSHSAKSAGYQYCDMGWVLATNKAVIKLIERCGGAPSKKYTIFEKKLT